MHNVPDPVENLSSGVHGNTVAASLQGEAESHQDDHTDETLWSTPDIDNLGECQLEKT